MVIYPKKLFSVVELNKICVTLFYYLSCISSNKFISSRLTAKEDMILIRKYSKCCLYILASWNVHMDFNHSLSIRTHLLLLPRYTIVFTYLKLGPFGSVEWNLVFLRNGISKRRYFENVGKSEFWKVERVGSQSDSLTYRHQILEEYGSRELGTTDSYISQPVRSTKYAFRAI